MVDRCGDGVNLFYPMQINNTPRNHTSKQKFDDFAMDCFGISIEEYLPNATHFKKISDGYYCTFWEYGIESPYCNILSGQAAKDKLVIAGHAGASMFKEEYKEVDPLPSHVTWNAATGLYEEMKPFSLVLRYNPNGTFS